MRISDTLTSPFPLSQAWGIGVLKKLLAAPPAPDPRREEREEAIKIALKKAPPLKIPDVSDRLMWRLVRMFRDIVFLTRHPDNDRGGAFASPRWYLSKYNRARRDHIEGAKKGAKEGKCSEATLRRWRAVLVECGWIANLSTGKHFLFVPLITPAQLLSFLPGFKRLLWRLLSGTEKAAFNKVPVPSSPDRGKNSNRPAPTEPARRIPAPPLSGEAMQVVVQAANAGVSDAEALVRKCGAPNVADAVAVVHWQMQRTATGKRKREVEDRASYIRAFAEGLAQEGDKRWKLPAKFLAERAAAERKAERDRAVRNHTYSAPPGSADARPPMSAMSAMPAAPAPAARTANSLNATPKAVQASLQSLAAPERDLLLQEALTLVRGELTAPAHAGMRKHIDELGTEHHRVQARALLLLLQRQKGDGCDEPEPEQARNAEYARHARHTRSESAVRPDDHSDDVGDDGARPREG